jgi:uncharacterized protein YggE
MRSKERRAVVVRLGCLIAVLAAERVSAAQPRRISVTGQGSVEIKANTLEMSVPVTGSAVLASDALTSFRQAQTRARDAIKALNLEGLSITSSGVSMFDSATVRAEQLVVNAPAVARARTAGGSVRFQELLTVRLSGLDQVSEADVLERFVKLSEAMKAAKAAGLAAGSPVFRREGPHDGREQALERAITDARTQAERMARLLGVRLGKVIVAEELSDPPRAVSSGQTLVRAVNPRVATTATAQMTLQATAAVSLQYEILD